MNDLATKQNDKQLATVEITPLQMIQTAMEKGLDAETIGKMMDLQERHEASQAKKAYVKAMNQFSEQRPRIIKDKRVHYKTTKGVTDYSHASLDGIIKAITPVLVKCGLSYNWITKQENNQIIVSCKVTHIDGHSEATQMSAGADNSGGKNSIQAVGSTTTYLQRYTLCSILGLSSSEDDDAEHSQELFLSPEQIETLNGLMIEHGIDPKVIHPVMKSLGASSMEKVRASDFGFFRKQISLKVAQKLRSTFKDAFETKDGWKLNEMADTLTDEQWTYMLDVFKTDKTKQKNELRDIMAQASSMWRDVISEYKEHQQNGDDLGMKQLEDDLPEYWRNRLKGMNDE